LNIWTSGTSGWIQIYEILFIIVNIVMHVFKKTISIINKYKYTAKTHKSKKKKKTEKLKTITGNENVMYILLRLQDFTHF